MPTNSMIDRIKKNSKVKHSALFTESELLEPVESVPTFVQMVNVALSGTFKGGITPGLSVIAGDSKHFKTGFSLLLASAYLKQYPDAVMLFYDCEYGSPKSYFDMFGIDLNRVYHIPVTNIEETKFDIISQLEGIERGERIIIVVDSIGNMASKKEIEDAINEKSVADMTRAKAIKGLFRMITPILNIKGIPMVVVGHTYSTMEMFSKDVLSGGKGVYYAANNIWIVGRQQDKSGTEVIGYDFVINIEKSRFVREKSKIPISISWEDGIDPYSGIMEQAVEAGFIVRSGAWYQVMDLDTGELPEKKVRSADIPVDYFRRLCNNERFTQFIKNKYALSHRRLLEMDTEEPTVVPTE